MEASVETPAGVMNKRVHLVYSGRVQGVGFRLTAEELARSLGVVGWIKNLRDGRVELMAEGDESVLAKFLDQLRTGPMRNFIKQVDITWGEWTGEFEEFQIRYF